MEIYSSVHLLCIEVLLLCSEIMLTAVLSDIVALHCLVCRFLIQKIDKDPFLSGLRQLTGTSSITQCLLSGVSLLDSTYEKKCSQGLADYLVCMCPLTRSDTGALTEL